MLGAALLTAAVTFFVATRTLAARRARRPAGAPRRLLGRLPAGIVGSCRRSLLASSHGPSQHAPHHRTGLVKTYSTVTALDGVDLTVPTGHRARPARTQRRRQDHHRPHPHHPPEARRRLGRGRRGRRAGARRATVRRRIGLSGQYAAVDEYLTGFENLDMIGRLYHLGRKQSRERARELLAAFRLEDAGDRPVQDVLGRHAPPARPRGRARGGPAGALPRRADHRARPARPHRHVGGHPGPRRRRARRSC